MSLSSLVCAFDFLTLELVWNVSRGTNNGLTNFGISATLRCQVMSKHTSDWWHDLITLTFDVSACGLSYSIPVPRLKFKGLPIWKIWHIFHLRIISLETLTFRPLNAVMCHPCHRLPSCQFLACYALAFSTYGQARDRRTDDGHQRSITHPMGWGHNNFKIHKCVLHQLYWCRPTNNNYVYSQLMMCIMSLQIQRNPVLLYLVITCNTILW